MAIKYITYALLFVAVALAQDSPPPSGLPTLTAILSNDATFVETDPPTTAAPTMAPETDPPTTPASTTPAPTTPAPTTTASTTPAPTTPAPTTQAPTTPAPTTQAPTTPAPTTTTTMYIPPETEAPKPQGCVGQKADVVLLLDSSGSVGAQNFMKQLNYVIDLVKTLNVGPDDVRVGLVTFSDDAHLQFNLQDHMNKQRLELALGFVPYQTGATYTNEGLQYIRENSFSPAVGGRPDAQKVVVVLTDGKSTDPKLTYSEARKLKQNGTIVISVGIGSSVDQNELELIASAKNYSIMAKDFDNLPGTIDNVTKLTCDAVNGINPGGDFVACEERAVDLVFLLDTSASEGVTHFREQTQFAAQLVSQLDIGPTKTQVGVATFGTDVNRQFFLNQYDNTQAVVDAIKQIPYAGGSTYTQKALEYARTTMFTQGYGHRPGVPKVVVVMTDGQSTNRPETRNQAELLRKEGYIVYGIGIGGTMDMTEVNNIATDPTMAYQVTTFDDLANFLPTLQAAYCEKVDQIVPFKPTKDPALADCENQMTDLVFVLDASSSEGINNFRKQLNFAGNVTQVLKIGPNDVQVGLMTFATSPRGIFYLNRYNNKYDILDAIKTTPYISGATYTGEALQYARENMLSTLHGRRLGSQQVVIVLTDGQSTNSAQTVAQAQQLKATGATVIAVGIGDRVDDAELTAIASDAAHKFSVNSFDFLYSIQQQIIKETCEGAGPTPTPHPECGNKPADIVFLMDASSSEGLVNFEKMKSFIADFSSQFNIGPNNVQISCVAFSTSVHVEFPLNGTASRRELLQKISNIKFYGGTTLTDKAFEVTRTQVLQPFSGARPNAADTVILLTDGRSVVPTETRRQADLLKAEGAQIITIGIGASVDTRELENMASDVQHAFDVASFDALNSIKQELVDTACQACATTEKADILLLVDSSSAESASLFQKEMDFIEKLVGTFSVGPNNAQFSLMTYATKVNVEFWFNAYRTQTEIQDALQKVVFTQGDSNTHEALKFAREYAYLPFHGARVNERQYVILVTDTDTANITATIQEANLLKAEGKTIIAVGIGANANKAQLESIATDASHVFIADDNDALTSLHKEITVKACQTIFEDQSGNGEGPSR